MTDKFNPADGSPETAAQMARVIEERDGPGAGMKALAEPPKRRQKSGYVGMPALAKLNLACREISAAFGVHCCYIVGSSLDRPDWRDVDVRLIMDDDKFALLFGGPSSATELTPFWQLQVAMISDRLSAASGLPVDFQIQSMKTANGPAHENGKREPCGLHGFWKDAVPNWYEETPG